MTNYDDRLDEAAQTFMAAAKGLGWSCYLHLVKNRDDGTCADVQSYGNLSERDLITNIQVLITELEKGVYKTRVELKPQ